MIHGFMLSHGDCCGNTLTENIFNASPSEFKKALDAWEPLIGKGTFVIFHTTSGKFSITEVDGYDTDSKSLNWWLARLRAEARVREIEKEV